MAEGEEDDDYMGDISLFLPPEDSSSSKKKFISKPNEPPFAPKLKRPKTLSWQEHRKFEKERKQREEDEQTKARLDASIPESNLGFRMLRQMGYKPGTALGKEGCGMAEPVGLYIRRSRAGIGRETPEEAASRKETEAAEMVRVREENMMAEFGSRQRTQWREKKVVGDYRKAEAALAQLENKEVLEAKKDEEGGDEKSDEAEEEVVITEEDLREILIKLREEQYYCLYCGFQYESEAALQSSCPGLHEEDH
ncbi:G patch domain-containing protein 11 [Phalaenopsis equestris]|uniref:G patch domain-containing protein 11 n=1 Tax=Phalaenopsis equestris TaxID=78828 RepID=UPI0009E252AE|nr:G patch domain-containing protein 11 [Phalaenopsis equestris]